MAETPEALKTEALGTLLSRLVDRARDTARAEVDYYKTLATQKAIGAVRPAVLFVFALLFVQAALTVLVIAIGGAIGLWLGVVPGLFIGALIGLLVAGLLAWIGVRLAGGGS